MAFKPYIPKDQRPPRILICGGRNFHDWSACRQAMRDFEDQRPFIIHGAARGADTLGQCWAMVYGSGHRPFPAQWKTLGKAAGFRRNTEMLVFGRPDLVVALPGGSGTGNMVKQAQARGVTVRDVIVPGWDNWWEHPRYA